MNVPILALEIRREHDVVLARQRARQLAELLGFEQQDQTRIATAVSEMARNAFRHAGGGRVRFSVSGDPPTFTARIADDGRGISDLRAVLEGRYESDTGLGLGILGAKRLMDGFEVDSSPGRGTTVVLKKLFPRRVEPPTRESIARIAAQLARERGSDPLEEVEQQNRELLRLLEELRRQREQLANVNKELEETNRGVVALYAELDMRADYLQRANEVKSRFLSNMTHEFRTPLNSILSLTRILLDRLDGDLTPEQERQVQFIAKAASDLSDLVNDLLDLAKVEAGKLRVRTSAFRVADLFGALRGTLKPLLAQNSSITLTIEEPDPGLVMETDEAKVSQILRNFVSNALKYTEHGEVRVSAGPGPNDSIVFSVADTGVGIPAEHQGRIFEEYTQVESPHQRRIRGTGLGLPLSKRLAALLGGSIRVESELGKGSTFYAVLPKRFEGPAEGTFVPEVSRELDPSRAPVLIVEDNPEALFVYEKLLKGAGFQILPARTLSEARQWLKHVRPMAVVLDILLEHESTWGFIGELRSAEATKKVPILVVTIVENEQRALAMGANAFHEKPVERAWLVRTLRSLVEEQSSDTLLVIDDDEASRYILRSLLADTRFRVVEAESGPVGLARARTERPRAIFLDLLMPGLDGFAVLERLKADPETRDLPVIVQTSKPIDEQDRRRLAAASAILPKDFSSREIATARVRDALRAAGAISAGEEHRP